MARREVKATPAETLMMIFGRVMSKLASLLRCIKCIYKIVTNFRIAGSEEYLNNKRKSSEIPI
jgi:hypothetical protein